MTDRARRIARSSLAVALAGVILFSAFATPKAEAVVVETLTAEGLAALATSYGAAEGVAFTAAGYDIVADALAIINSTTVAGYAAAEGTTTVALAAEVGAGITITSTGAIIIGVAAAAILAGIIAYAVTHYNISADDATATVSHQLSIGNLVPYSGPFPAYSVGSATAFAAVGDSVRLAPNVNLRFMSIDGNTSIGANAPDGATTLLFSFVTDSGAIIPFYDPAAVSIAGSSGPFNYISASLSSKFIVSDQFPVTFIFPVQSNDSAAIWAMSKSSGRYVRETGSRQSDAWWYARINYAGLFGDGSSVASGDRTITITNDGYAQIPAPDENVTLIPSVIPSADDADAYLQAVAGDLLSGDGSVSYEIDYEEPSSDTDWDTPPDVGAIYPDGDPEDVPESDPDPSGMLPAGAFGFWHYVIELLEFGADGISAIYEVFSSLPYALKLPLYAGITLIIIFGFASRLLM